MNISKTYQKRGLVNSCIQVTVAGILSEGMGLLISSLQTNTSRQASRYRVARLKENTEEACNYGALRDYEKKIYIKEPSK